MRIAGKEIKDECVHCGEILECELFKQGHGIRQERMNVVQMISCQMKHREKRNAEQNAFDFCEYYDSGCMVCDGM